jgi:hypothetical protein
MTDGAGLHTIDRRDQLRKILPPGIARDFDEVRRVEIREEDPARGRVEVITFPQLPTQDPRRERVGAGEEYDSRYIETRCLFNGDPPGNALPHRKDPIMPKHLRMVSRRAQSSRVLGLLVVASMSSASPAQNDPDDTAGSLDSVGSFGPADSLDTGAIEDYTLYPITPTGQDESRRIRFVFSTGGEYQFDAGIDRAGDFSVIRASAGLGFSVPVADRLSVAIGTSFGYATYDFDSAAVFGGGTPWEDIFTGQVSAIANYALDDTWSLFGGGLFGMAGEDGADFGDSTSGGGMIGAGYRHSDRLTFRVGVSVMSQIEDDAVVMPVLLMDWKIDERWRLRLGSLDTASGDLIGGGLSYAISERLSVGGRLGWVRSRFRLDDSGYAPDGVGQDDRFKGTVVLNWRITDNVDVSVHGGVVFGGELRVENESGDRLFKEDYDPAALVGARLAWRF